MSTGGPTKPGIRFVGSVMTLVVMGSACWIPAEPLRFRSAEAAIGPVAMNVMAQADDGSTDMNSGGTMDGNDDSGGSGDSDDMNSGGGSDDRSGSGDSGSSGSSGGGSSRSCDTGFTLMSVPGVRSMVALRLVNTVTTKDVNRDGWLCLKIVPGTRRSTTFVDN